jgi:hypothetical protein
VVEAVLLDAGREVIRGRQDGRDVQAVPVVLARRTGTRTSGRVRAASCAGVGLVGADALGAAAEQGDGAAGVTAAGVGQADRDLGQALPQVALVRRSGLPGRLEDLVGMERAAVAEQLVGQDGGVVPGDDEVIGDAVQAGIRVGVV